MRQQHLAVTIPADKRKSFSVFGKRTSVGVRSPSSARIERFAFARPHFCVAQLVGMVSTNSKRKCLSTPSYTHQVWCIRPTGLLDLSIGWGERPLDDMRPVVPTGVPPSQVQQKSSDLP